MLLRRRLVPAVGVTVLLLASIPAAIPSQAQEVASGPSSFSGSVSAVAARITVNFKGFPVTDVPVDGGGPTAQAVVDSLGSTTGYAAFPDPGSFLVGVPGLLAGLASTGVAGLPPVSLPPIPPYPFAITTDASNPEQVLGSGPYELRASSTTERSEATATAGLSTPAGAVALLKSAASVEPVDDTVVAKAATTLEGLTIGPLSIGSVVSRATYTLDSSGTATPKTELRVSGLKVGGIGVDITDAGLDVAGTVVPLPVGGILSQLLSGAGITVEFLAGETFPNRVVAPAIRITVPYASPEPIPGLGDVSGFVALTFGAATAELTGTATEPPVESDTSVDIGSEVVTSGADLGGDLGASAPLDLPEVAPVTPPAAGGGSTQPLGGVVEASALPELDLASLYLVVGGSAILALAVGHLIRRLGVSR